MSFYRLFVFAVFAFDLLCVVATLSVSRLPGGVTWLVVSGLWPLLLATIYVATKWNAPDPLHVAGNLRVVVRVVFAVLIIGVPVSLATTLFIFHMIRLYRH